MQHQIATITSMQKEYIANETVWNYSIEKSTLGAAIGYSSGKNNSNLKTPPTHYTKQEKLIPLHVKIMTTRRKDNMEVLRLKTSSHINIVEGKAFVPIFHTTPCAVTKDIDSMFFHKKQLREWV